MCGDCTCNDYVCKNLNPQSVYANLRYVMWNVKRITYLYDMRTYIRRLMEQIFGNILQSQRLRNVYMN